jgi:hypothetical protein
MLGCQHRLPLMTLVNEIMSFSNLTDGLKLPGRGITIPWGGSYESLKPSASYAKDWMVHGHDVRYGQLHWDEEVLLPELPTKTG